MSGGDSDRLRKQVRATRKRLQKLDTPWAKSHDARLREAEELLDANTDRLTAAVKRTKRREVAEERALCRKLFAQAWHGAAKDAAALGLEFPTEPDERDEVVIELTGLLYELAHKAGYSVRRGLMYGWFVSGAAAEALDKVDAELAPIDSSVRASYRALSREHDCAEAALEEGAEVPLERFKHQE